MPSTPSRFASGGPNGRSAPPISTIMSAMRDAASLLRRGRAAEAVAAYRRIVKSHPDNPEAHHNLGVALRSEGHGEEAIAAYRRAIELRPGYAAAHHHLAQALDAAGRPMEALKHHFQAYRLANDREDFAQALAAALRPVRLKSASPIVVDGIARLFGASDLDRQDLMAVTVSLILARETTAEAPSIAERPWNEASGSLKAWWTGAEGRALAADPLFRGLLRETILSDEKLERLTAALRRLLLESVAAGEALGDDEGAAASLACQGYATGYAAPESAEETRLVEALLARLGDAPPATLAELVLTISMYRPLGSVVQEIVSGLRHGSSELAIVIGRQIDEPAQERELAASIPSLAPINDAVSQAVQRQYEENPYPRWRSITRRPARPLAEVVGGLFPAIDTASIPAPPHRILVAGCGTGRHALNVAFRYAGADILALDLSRRSLAYGARRAQEFGVDNIRFRQADILDLGTLGERFDLIEASGVLHHMADPQQGWRILVDLLKPGGFIKLGLYSRLGRETIERARRFVAERGLAATPEGLRAARAAIRALPVHDPVRKVADELDFATLDGCRDLLFHVQEQSFTLPQVGEAIRGLGLVFLGFETIDEQARAAYAKLFPDDRARLDLACWHQVEEQRPATFRAMYQFWCRRP